MEDFGRLTKAISSLAIFPLLLAIAMFVPAGIGWWQGWLFLLVFLVQMIVAYLYLWRTNPEVVVARSKIQAGTKAWDKGILLLLILAYLAIFLTAAFDVRFHCSSVSPFFVVLGYVLFSLGMIGTVWVQSVNKFAERGIRIQTDRAHKVIATGPYAIVRHPFYFAFFLIYLGVPLALGSFWALIPAVVGSTTLVVRTIFEDRTLHEELEGYKEYAGRVRYRLVPGVW